TVGPRSKEKGFQEAKVIQDGEFIVGYGGGVCQASTTLYNAAVLAGLKITARKAHSLAVHYVEPSRDAMVSSYTDFRFRNEYAYPVYVSMKVRGDAVTATFYGKDEGYRYEIVSQVTAKSRRPTRSKGGETSKGLYGRARRLKSEAYLETYLYGKLINGKSSARTAARPSGRHYQKTKIKEGPTFELRK
ncbi:MAG: VanW family protein, partial [Christensenellaceae bacterium]